MRRPRPIALFWTAVVVDILALGVVWSTWKGVQTSPLALLIAIPAALVCVGAAAVAGRVLTVVTRAQRMAASDTTPTCSSDGRHAAAD